MRPQTIYTFYDPRRTCQGGRWLLLLGTKAVLCKSGPSTSGLKRFWPLNLAFSIDFGAPLKFPLWDGIVQSV